MKIRRVGLLFLVLILALSVGVTAASAKKPMIAGGKNQREGTSGTVGEWLFNGTTRFKVYSVAYPATDPKGVAPSQGKTWMLISLEVRNAQDLNSNYGGNVGTLTVFDNDGMSTVAGHLVKATDWEEDLGGMIAKAAGFKGVCVAEIDSAFKAVRLIYELPSNAPVFRVSLPVSMQAK